jgi:ABC-2 type transport system permease protein
MTVMEVPAKDTPTITATTQARAVLLSEWTKLRSVRSSVWALIATTGITVGLSVLLCWAYVNRHAHLSPIEQLAFDPTGRSLRGIFLAQLAVGVLGVLLMSSEWRWSSVRSRVSRHISPVKQSFRPRA